MQLRIRKILLVDGEWISELTISCDEGDRAPATSMGRGARDGCQAFHDDACLCIAENAEFRKYRVGSAGVPSTDGCEHACSCWLFDQEIVVG